MSCEPYECFKGVYHIGNNEFLNELEVNLKVFMDWGMLKIGGWTDVDIPSSGAYGGDFSRLRLAHDPSYETGQVWEGVRKDWVWETGVNYENGITYNPANVTGVVVNGVSYPTGDSTYGFYVDYPNGRVVFNSGISTSHQVQAEYSYRDVQVYIADNAPYWDEVQQGSLRVDNNHFLTTYSGNWSVNPQHRVQLPAIIIEAVPRSFSKGYQLGDGALDAYQDVLFHVVAENRWMRNQLIDIIRKQEDRTIYLFNTNLMISQTGYPLDSRGMVRTNPTTYPVMVSPTGDGGYRWQRCRFEQVTISEVESVNPELHLGTARVTFNVVLPDN